jgi:hypothetical protein
VQQELIVVGAGIVVLAFGLVQTSRAARAGGETPPPAGIRTGGH